MFQKIICNQFQVGIANQLHLQNSKLNQKAIQRD